MTAFMLEPNRLRDFVVAFSALLDGQPSEGEIIERGKPLLRELLAHDDWLPDRFALPHPAGYQQYLLHMDSSERFSVISFAWGPGQRTPIHDHTVWCLIGVLRGAEWSQAYVEAPVADAALGARYVPHGFPSLLSAGEVEAVSPAIGDVHEVSNAFHDKVSVSIHVYGANVGRLHRSIFTPAGERKPFVSGYANRVLPNIWQRAGMADDIIGPPRAFGASSVQDVRQALLDRREICLLDVREAAEHAKGHPLFAVNLPLSRLELDVHIAIPRRSTPIVVLGDEDDLAERAARRLSEWGYDQVTLLHGGLTGWMTGGGELFEGLHVPSRCFAVLAEQAHRNGTIAQHPKVLQPIGRTRRRTLALRAGVRVATVADVERMQADRHRTTYVFDIRPAEAYEAGHLPGARPASARDLIDHTEALLPVRGARVVLIDGLQRPDGDEAEAPDAACALTTASWLAQMAIEAYVLEGVGEGVFTRKGAWRAPIPDVFEGRLPLPSASVAQLRHWLAGSERTTIIDLGPSDRYLRVHIPGACFAIRSRLMRDVGVMPRPARYVLMADDPMLAALAALDLTLETSVPALVLIGGLAAWRAEGLAVQSGATRLVSPPIDRVEPAAPAAAGAGKDAGAIDAAHDEWAFDLVEKLARDGTHGFRLA